MSTTIAHRPTRHAITALALSLSLLSACAGTTTTTTTANTTVASVTPNKTPTSAVLPVASNPITNTSTNKVLTINDLLVENNTDANGKAAPDHLEFTITNTGASPARNIEVYYQFDDKTTGVTEGYYTKLPTTFEIPAGAKHTVHFDNTGAPDHYPVNKFSLYHTSKNALVVTVSISASDAAIATNTVQKDPGGTETAD